MAEILRTEGLTKRFGGLVAVDQVTASFLDDQLQAVIGPNGAGKTTFFNLMSGTLQPSDGEIIFKGEDITDLPPDEVAQRGLLRSFQITNVFQGLSVLENVRIAAQTEVGLGSYSLWKDADDLEALKEKAESALQRVGLAEKRDESAQNLSHGEQRMLELAIVLSTDPDMLLLDEPTSGMSAEDTSNMTEIIQSVAEDLPILLIEHKMSVVLDVADRILVLHQGRKIAEGEPGEIKGNEEVREVYLGDTA